MAVSDTYASFSPDGLSILHRRVDGAKSQIFVMNANTTTITTFPGEHARRLASLVERRKTRGVLAAGE